MLRENKYEPTVYQVLSEVPGDRSEGPDFKLLTFLFFRNSQTRNHNVNQHSPAHWGYFETNPRPHTISSANAPDSTLSLLGRNGAINKCSCVSGAMLDPMTRAGARAQRAGCGHFPLEPSRVESGMIFI